MTPPRRIALLRLVAQRIVGPPFRSVVDAVRWMTAMQAQDFNGVLTSVALRTSPRSRTAVVAALDAGEVVKSWPMRGTLHLVAADDLAWMLGLMAPRAAAKATHRRAGLGLDHATLEQGRDVATSELSGGRRLSRHELFAVWDEAGVSTAGQRGAHILGYLAQTGTLCFGPTDDGRQQLIVLVDEWIPHPRRLERDEALGELAGRYFRSHGPATVKDLMRWGHLEAADSRAGVALARPRLASLEVDGVEHLMDPGTPELLDRCRQEAGAVLLLPGFDELILGYQDRTCVLAPEHAGVVVPGGNGMFKATVVSDGEVVGTWKHAGRGPKRTVQATPFSAFSDAVDDAIAQAYAELP